MIFIMLEVAMNYSIIGIVLAWSFSALAQQSPNYEIPVSERDYKPEQSWVDHSEFRVKLVKCQGKDYGVLYQSYWGWSSGSKFAGVCEWKNRTSIEKCGEDAGADTINCYNKAIDRFGLQAKYPKVNVKETARPQTPVPQEDIPDLDNPAVAP